MWSTTPVIPLNYWWSHPVMVRFLLLWKLVYHPHPTQPHYTPHPHPLLKSSWVQTSQNLVCPQNQFQLETPTMPKILMIENKNIFDHPCWIHKLTRTRICWKNRYFWFGSSCRHYKQEQLGIEYGILDSMLMSNTVYVLFVKCKIMNLCHFPLPKSKYIPNVLIVMVVFN